MKNIKLIAIIIILIITNLYLFVSVAFEIKYRALIDDYSKLSVQYHELNEKYIAQEEMLKEVMSANKQENISIADYLGRLFKLKNIDSNLFTTKISKIEWKSIIETIINPNANR